MTITINGETQPIDQEMTIREMLDTHGFGDKIVAVAVNGAFVPKSEHNTAQIKDGDSIEIVAPMQGG